MTCFGKTHPVLYITGQVNFCGGKPQSECLLDPVWQKVYGSAQWLLHYFLSDNMHDALVS
jgi:hypothetical protein